MPGYCYHVIAVNRGDTNFLVTTRDELVAFFAPIDDPVEALLVALASGFDWWAGSGGTDASQGGYRAVADGFELIVTDLVSGCLPVQTDRVLIHVADDGTITERRRQILSVLCGACI